MKAYPPGQSSRGPTRMVLFHREGMFYPLELPISDDLAAHAHANPGTLKITNISGDVLWSPKKDH